MVMGNQGCNEGFEGAGGWVRKEGQQERRKVGDKEDRKMGRGAADDAPSSKQMAMRLLSGPKRPEAFRRFSATRRSGMVCSEVRGREKRQCVLHGA